MAFCLQSDINLLGLQQKGSVWHAMVTYATFVIIWTRKPGMSSTGLTASNFLNWGPFVMALLFILMFFGACAGSTSGGAKIDRLLFLLKSVPSGKAHCRCS